MGAKPTLGYPSRTEAVIALRQQGLSTTDIAGRIGISPGTVTALECSAQRSAKPRGVRPAEQHGRTIVFPIDVLEALRPYALRRQLTVNALARRLIETIADDGMVDAILDDELTEHSRQ